MRRRPVIVVGAGLNGLACAFALASAGRPVVVLERNAWLGGRTASWNDAGMSVESGFHRFRGIYRALPRLLRRAGLDLTRVVHWQTSAELRVAGERPATIGVAPFRDPLPVLRTLFGDGSLLSARDRLSIVPLLLLLSGFVAHYRCRSPRFPA